MKGRRYFFAVCVAALFASQSPGSALAQFATRPLALSDYYTFTSIEDPAMSPAGDRVAFVRTTILEAENRRHREVWIVPADGSGPAYRVSSPVHESSDPLWSPDGATLAFRSERGDSGSYWFLDMTGGREAFQIAGVTGRPLYSPDGGWIAFTRATEPTGQAATRSRSGRGRYDQRPEAEVLIEERFQGRIFDWMAYRFDGRGYLPDPRDPVATPPRELYVVPTSGGEPRRLTRTGTDVVDVAWAPDSEALAYASDEFQRDELTYPRHDLWIVELDGNQRRLTEDDAVNRAPEWTADGSALVFRRSDGLDRIIREKRDRGASVELLRLDLDSGATTELTANWDLRPGGHQVVADNRVLFAAQVSGENHLFATPAAGGPVVQVTRERRWLNGFTFDGTGRTMAFVGQSSSRPGELYAARSDGSAEVRLTSFNDLAASRVQLIVARPLTVSSADGTEIEGWAVLPTGYTANTGPYPMIVSMHGGPHSSYGERFSFAFQLLATEGHIVVYFNPRGSTGYGEDFLWATWGGWGNLDLQDVMAGVDHALTTYEIDPARLGVTGYSYGGFLTNWAITQTHRFGAAVSGAGISNWVSDYGTADIPRTKETEFYGPPWETRGGELLWSQSPIKHAAGVSTPTLFVHGEDDFRVPIEQAEQMYTALRKQDVAARFVRYPGTSHGGWTPWDTVHRMYQELRWWREYLGDGRTSRP